MPLIDSGFVTTYRGISVSRKRILHGAEFEARLLKLCLGPRVRHDPVPGEQTSTRAVDIGAPQRDPELAVSVRIDPTHRPAIATPINALESPYRLHRRRARHAADGCGWVQGASDLERRPIACGRSGNARRDVLNVRQLQQERSFGGDPVAHAVENLRDRIDREPMLSIVLGRLEQLRADFAVHRLVLTPARRSGKHQRLDRGSGATYQELGRRANECSEYEGVALGEAPRKARRQYTPVERTLRPHKEIARQDHFVEFAGSYLPNRSINRLDPCQLRDSRTGVPNARNALRHRRLLHRRWEVPPKLDARAVAVGTQHGARNDQLRVPIRIKRETSESNRHRAAASLDPAENPIEIMSRLPEPVGSPRDLYSGRGPPRDKPFAIVDPCKAVRIGEGRQKIGYGVGIDMVPAVHQIRGTHRRVPVTICAAPRATKRERGSSNPAPSSISSRRPRAGRYAVDSGR